MREGGAAERADPAGLGYVPAIDGLRCIAILSVLLYHLRPMRLPGGFAGVDLFFVISGFVVTASVARRDFPGFAGLLAHFYARRFLRILPALFVLLIAVSLLSVLFVPMVNDVTNAQEVALAAFLGAGNIVLAASNFGYFEASSGMNPLLHTWTLGVEEQFYLLFPFLYWLSLRRDGPACGRLRIAPVAAASALSLLLAVAWPGDAALDPFYMMPTRFWELGAGMLLFITMPRWAPRLRRAPQPLVAAGYVAGAAALAWSFARIEVGTMPFPGSLLPVSASAVLIALVCARPAAPASRLLAAGPMVFVGRISYSLYLWHWPVFVLFRWTVGIDGRAVALAALALAFALSVASYHLVEQPLRRSPRARAAPGGRVVAAGAAAALLSCALAALIFRADASLSLRRYVATGAALDLPPGGGCPLDEARRGLARGEVATWQPRCARAAPAPRLFVLGDSHALSYRPMLRQYAAETGAPVSLYTHQGCELPPVRAPLSDRCERFFRAATAEIAPRLGRGDVVLMVAMHIRPLDRFWVSHRAPAADRRSRPVRPSTARAEALSLLRPLAATGARLVIEAPKPVFRSPPFVCMDGYGRNAVCAGGFAVGRAELLARREPALRALADLARRVPGASVWDPFPILCPGRVCNAFADGRPLFWDGHHVNRFANERIYPAFKAYVLGARCPGGADAAAGPADCEAEAAP